MSFRLKFISFSKKILKFFIILILGLVCIFYFALHPKKNDNFDNFRVCVVHNNITDTLRLEDFNTSRNDYDICTRTIKLNNRKGDFYSLELKLMNSESGFKEWEMIEMSGGPGDPMVYRYKVKDRGIPPPNKYN